MKNKYQGFILFSFGVFFILDFLVSRVEGAVLFAFYLYLSLTIVGVIYVFLIGFMLCWGYSVYTMLKQQKDTLKIAREVNEKTKLRYLEMCGGGF